MALYPEDEKWTRPDDQDFPIEKYAMEMLRQLKIHDKEKTVKFQDLTTTQLIKLASTEFQKRFQNAELMSDAELELNAVHMGNYYYFLWSQLMFKKASE